MLSISRIRQLLEDPDMSAEKAEEIRDALRSLAEIIFEKWQAEKRNKSQLQDDRKTEKKQINV